MLYKAWSLEFRASGTNWVCGLRDSGFRLQGLRFRALALVFRIGVGMKGDKGVRFRSWRAKAFIMGFGGFEFGF